MKLAGEIREKLGDSWLAELYQAKVRSQRTRAYHLEVPQKENKPEILYTLLGIELKVGNRRFSCPDLATARYLRVFARIGCTDVAVPYDITKISVVADFMETAWHQMLLMIQMQKLTETSAIRLRTALVKTLRGEISRIGAGDAMPAFDRETRQRK